MKANELRLGNFVKTNDNTIDIFKVYCIGIDYVFLTDDYEDYDSIIDNLKPIPLTEEWLLKFGFEKRPDVDVYDSDGGSNCTEFYKKDGVSISFYRGNFWDATINHELDFNLEYVHLLQNFWMCYKQEELTIKNK